MSDDFSKLSSEEREIFEELEAVYTVGRPMSPREKAAYYRLRVLAQGGGSREASDLVQGLNLLEEGGTLVGKKLKRFLESLDS